MTKTVFLPKNDLRHASLRFPSLQAIRLESTEHLLSSPRLHDKLPDVYTMVASGHLCQSAGQIPQATVYPPQGEPLPSFANKFIVLIKRILMCIYIHMKHSIRTQAASAIFSKLQYGRYMNNIFRNKKRLTQNHCK